VYDTNRHALRARVVSLDRDVEGDDAQGGELTFGFKEAPVRLPMKVTRLESPGEVEWDCPGGFRTGRRTSVLWSIEPSEHGAKVVFRPRGVAGRDAEYDSAGQPSRGPPDRRLD